MVWPCPVPARRQHRPRCGPSGGAGPGRGVCAFALFLSAMGKKNLNKNKPDLSSKQPWSCAAAPAGRVRQHARYLPPLRGTGEPRTARGQRGTGGDASAALGSWGGWGGGCWVRAPLRGRSEDVAGGSGVGAVPGPRSPSALTALRPRVPALPRSARSAARAAAEEQREGN